MPLNVLNCTVGEAIHTGRTTYTNLSHIIMKDAKLLMMLFITSWFRPLTTNPSRQICTYATWVKHFLPNANLITLFVSATA